MTDDPTAGVIARLEGEGESVAEGGFTIDGEAARHKLAQAQLAEPEAWVLLVLEAAERVGSVRVEIHETIFGLRVRLEGHGAVELAPPAQLEGMFDWMFEEPHAMPEPMRKHAASRRLLALAINAATGRSRRVVLRGRSPELGRKLTIRGESSGTIASAGTGEPRLDIDCYDWRTRPFTVRAESLLVVARAGYGQWPIHVGGRPVPRQPRLGTRRAEGFVELDGERIGRAAIVHARTEPRLVLVSNGVELEVVPLAGYTWGFHAVVEDAVGRDLSLGRAVQDARYDAVLDCVAEVHDRLVAQLRAAQVEDAALVRWNGAGSLGRVPAPRARMPVASVWEVYAMPAATAGAFGFVLGAAMGVWSMVAIFGVMGLAAGYVLVQRARQLQLYGEILDIEGSIAEATRRVDERRRRNR